MIHPIPPGTRDVLPEEMRELRRLQRALIEVFEERGYGEVSTPAIEYDEVMAWADGPARSSYRFFDESGELLTLRSDMTVPIARLVATRFASGEPPFRFSYLANGYRPVRPQRGQMREFVQAGVELIGASPEEGKTPAIAPARQGPLQRPFRSAPQGRAGARRSARSRGRSGGCCRSPWCPPRRAPPRASTSSYSIAGVATSP